MNSTENIEFKEYIDEVGETQNPLNGYQIAGYDEDKFLRFLTYCIDTDEVQEDYKWQILEQMAPIRGQYCAKTGEKEAQIVAEFCDFSCRTVAAIAVARGAGLSPTELYSERWEEFKGLVRKQIQLRTFDCENEIIDLNKKIWSRRNELITQGKATNAFMGGI